MGVSEKAKAITIAATLRYVNLWAPVGFSILQIPAVVRGEHFLGQRLDVFNFGDTLRDLAASGGRSKAEGLGNGFNGSLQVLCRFLMVLSRFLS